MLIYNVQQNSSFQMIESNSTTLKGNHSKTVEKLKTYYRMCLNQSAIDKLDSTPLTQVK